MRTPGNIRSYPPDERRGRTTTAAPASTRPSPCASIAAAPNIRAGALRNAVARPPRASLVIFFVSPRCGACYTFDWSTNPVLASRGRRVMAHSRATLVSGTQLCNSLNRPPILLQTQQRSEIISSHVAPRSIGDRFGICKNRVKSRDAGADSRSCQHAFNALGRSS